jgi:hypothetical protein
MSNVNVMSALCKSNTLYYITILYYYIIIVAPQFDIGYLIIQSVKYYWEKDIDFQQKILIKNNKVQKQFSN